MNKAALHRFLQKVDITSGCWNWVAFKSVKGYGRFRINSKIRFSHRVSYEHYIGQIPDGFQIDHLCRNRGCVNPDHLEAVTPLDNHIRGLMARDTCKNGHFYPEGKLVCRICAKNTRAEWFRRRREEMIAAKERQKMGLPV